MKENPVFILYLKSKNRSFFTWQGGESTSIHLGKSRHESGAKIHYDPPMGSSKMGTLRWSHPPWQRRSIKKTRTKNARCSIYAAKSSINGGMSYYKWGDFPYLCLRSITMSILDLTGKIEPIFRRDVPLPGLIPEGTTMKFPMPY